MLLPVLLAVVAGVVSGLVVTALSKMWVRVSANRRALSSYVASRTVRRRRAGILMVLPVTAAMAIAVFSHGISRTASTWRADAAATQVGAASSYPTRLPLGRAVALTHQLDPHGRWLAAAGVVSPNTPGGDTAESLPRVVVDAPRLGRVAAWQGSWTPGTSAAAVGRLLAPTRPPVSLTGHTITLGLDDQVVGDYHDLGVDITMLDSDGAVRQVVLGPFAPGRSTATARLHNCPTGCTVQQVYFGGPSALVEAMHGEVTIDRVTVDSRPSSALFTSGWRPSDDLAPGIRQAVRQRPRSPHGALQVAFDTNGQSSQASITPNDVPRVVPVLWGRLASQHPTLADGNGGTFQTRSIGTAASMPIRGPSGVLMDYSTFVRHATIQYGTTQTFVWARADTPATILNALAQHGFANPDTVTAADHTLGQDAFALALRLYGVVTVLVILLALAGLAVTLAVQLPARRRDVAALRVLGVRKRSLMLGVLAEFFVVLGAATIAGVCAGSIAQHVVVRAVTLGFVDSDQTPRIEPTLDVAGIVELAAVTLLVLLAGGFVLAGVTVRGARTATLREDAR
jgi:hypothetical protein